MLRAGGREPGTRAGLRGPGGEHLPRAMPARNARIKAPVEVLAARIDGVLLAPIGGQGVWGALRSVRRAMSSLRENGSVPRTAFVVAMSPDGRIVPGRTDDASVFVVGYRLEHAL
jgi:hypothetical protein